MCRGVSCQLQAPNLTYRFPFGELPYCNQTSLTNLYQTPQMEYAYYQGPCVSLDEKQVVYPPDEANAMFITTRQSQGGIYKPTSECNGRVSLPPPHPLEFMHHICRYCVRAVQ